MRYSCQNQKRSHSWGGGGGGLNLIIVAFYRRRSLTTNVIVITSLFSKLPAGDGEEIFRSLSQAATYPPVYHTR